MTQTQVFLRFLLISTSKRDFRVLWNYLEEFMNRINHSTAILINNGLEFNMCKNL